MKKLLVATDFSANAKHAAEYGYYLASKLKANLVLCNSFIVPAEVPEAAFVAWPMYEYDELLKGSVDELTKLKTELDAKSKNGVFAPQVSCVNEVGIVADVISEVAKKRDIELIIIGTHRNNTLSALMMGNHTRKMIDNTTRPLLLVPPTAEIGPIKKIAFAFDFKAIERDLDIIYQLIELVRPLNAELLIAHVDDDKMPSSNLQKFVQAVLTDISNKADYPLIYYRAVKSSTPEKGLDWLYGHGQVDILAMVHHQYNFFEKLIKGSHTQKMAGHISIPLLVLPSH